MPKLINVSFTVGIKNDVTKEQIQERLEFLLGARGQMSLDNPLVDIDIDANSFSVIFNEC